MKIEKITLYHVKLKLKKPFITGFGEISHQESLLVKIESEGLVGWGEAPHIRLPLYCNEFLESGKILLEKYILPNLVNRDINTPYDGPKVWNHLKGNNISKSAPEMALWDLFAKKEKLPLNRYLNAKRDFSPVGISIGIQGSVEDLLDEVEKAVEFGYKRLKIKIKPGADIEYIKKVRKLFPEENIMVDANSSYRLSDVELLKELDKYNLMMIEQPLSADDIVYHSKIQKQISTPICLDESLHSAEDVEKAIYLNSCKIVNLKLSRVGGIAEALKTHDLCKENNIPLWIGGMLETGVGKAFLDHLSTLDAVTLPGDNSPQTRYYDEDIVIGGSTFKNGIITLNNSSGIGVDIDDEKLNKYTVEKIEIV